MEIQDIYKWNADIQRRWWGVISRPKFDEAQEDMTQALKIIKNLHAKNVKLEQDIKVLKCGVRDFMSEIQTIAMKHHID